MSPMSDLNRSEFRIGVEGDPLTRSTDIRPALPAYDDGHDKVQRPVVEATAEHGFAVGHIAFKGADFPPVEPKA